MANSEKRSIRKRLSPDEWEIVKQFREDNKGIADAVQEVGVDIKNAPRGWLKTKEASIYFNNPLAQDGGAKDLDFESVFADLAKKYKEFKLPKEPVKKEKSFDRLVYTDTHIGMHPNKDGTAMYPADWNEGDIIHSVKTMIKQTLENRSSPILYIDDLGDFMDGWDALTTRGGHELPQVMSNQEAYDLGVKFKVMLLTELSPYYDKVISNNVCNSNHGGDFDYVVNQAVKSVADISFKNVEVNNQTDIIKAYTFGRYVIPLLHGKDTKHQKKPMPAKLNGETKEQLENWLIEKQYIKPGAVIEVSKGDTHQYIFDYSTSQYFDYFCYPALSPNSQYVHTNYKKGKRGFVFHSYGATRSVEPYIFD